MKKQTVASKIAYPAVLGALSLIFVYIGAVVPSGNWGLVAVAGLFPAAVVISVSLKAGFLCWAGVSVLSFLLLPGKFCALLYTVLLGLYPMIKALIERLHMIALEYILKLIFFNAAFTLIFLVTNAAMLASLPAALGVTWVLYLAANVVFLIYDFGFTKLIVFYITRISRGVR